MSGSGAQTVPDDPIISDAGILCKCCRGIFLRRKFLTVILQNAGWITGLLQVQRTQTSFLVCEGHKSAESVHICAQLAGVQRKGKQVFFEEVTNGNPSGNIKLCNLYK